MTTADGCTLEAFDQRAKPRIKWGDETRFRGIDSWPPDKDERCHDCGALPGHYHHPGCDMDECPDCHRQAIGCDCR